MRIFRTTPSCKACLCLLIMVLSGCAVPVSSLNRAIRTNDIAAVKQQVSSGTDLNRFGHLNSTPLITAVQQQNEDIARLLLVNNADPNLSDSEDREPLKEAVKLRDYAMVQLLLKEGADPAQGKCDALYTAIEITHDDKMVELLVNNGGDLHKLHAYDAVDYKDATELFVELPSRIAPSISSSVVISGNVLFVAINKGYLDIVRVLLQQGADVNETDSTGRSPLLVAVINKEKDITRLLLDNYTPDLSSNHQAEYALQYAQSHNLDEIADMLRYAMESGKIHS